MIGLHGTSSTAEIMKYTWFHFPIYPDSRNSLANGCHQLMRRQPLFGLALFTRARGSPMMESTSRSHLFGAREGSLPPTADLGKDPRIRRERRSEKTGVVKGWFRFGWDTGGVAMNTQRADADSPSVRAWCHGVAFCFSLNTPGGELKLNCDLKSQGFALTDKQKKKKKRSCKFPNRDACDLLGDSVRCSPGSPEP